MLKKDINGIMIYMYIHKQFLDMQNNAKPLRNHAYVEKYKNKHGKEKSQILEGKGIKSQARVYRGFNCICNICFQ